MVNTRNTATTASSPSCSEPGSATIDRIDFAAEFQKLCMRIDEQKESIIRELKEELSSLRQEIKEVKEMNEILQQEKKLRKIPLLILKPNLHV